MSKHRNRVNRLYTGSPTRQQLQKRQHDKEILEAKQGYIEKEYEQEDDEDQVDDDDAKIMEKIGQNPDEKSRKWYVLDTNLILSCVDVIYDDDDEEWQEPLNFKPRLDNANLIIPKVVYDELNNIKKEISYRGMVARTALKRLTKYFPNSERSLDDIMYLKSPIATGWGKQTVSILPLHKDFHKILPWVPKKEDNDGWIAVTALAATLIREGKKVDGSLSQDPDFDIMKVANRNKSVSLLTNDNGLLSDADEYGVRTERYSFQKPAPFTGIRELTVPVEMFELFYHEEKLSRKEFEEFLPHEPSLVTNEFIVMTPEDDVYPRGYFSNHDKFINIARYHSENEMLYPLRFMKRCPNTPPNAGIAAYYDALYDDKIEIINVTGDAGTGKTFQAITYAFQAVQAGRYVKAVLIPSRPAKNPLGALPGNQDQKMEPLVAAAKDAIRSYLAKTPEFIKMRENLKKYGDVIDDEEDIVNSKKRKREKDGRDRQNYLDSRHTRGSFNGSFNDLDYGSNDVDPEDFDEPHSKKKGDKTFYPSKSDKKPSSGKLSYYERLEKETNYLYNRYFISMPYEDAEGRSFDDCIIILDEFQRVQIDDCYTLITRPGERAKLIICGDLAQIHEISAEKQWSNGLNYSRMLCFDEPNAANIHLTKNMRGGISRTVTKNRRKIRRIMGFS